MPHYNNLDPVVDWDGLGRAGLGGAGLLGRAAGLGRAGLGRWAVLGWPLLCWAGRGRLGWSGVPSLTQPSQAQSSPLLPRIDRNSTVNSSDLLSLLKIFVSTLQIRRVYCRVAVNSW